MSKPRRRGRATTAPRSREAKERDAPPERDASTPSAPAWRARWAVLAGGVIASAAVFAVYARVEAPWFLLGFVVLVPWILVLPCALSWREAAGAGCAMSAAFVVAVFPWLPDAAAGYAHAPSLVTWLVAIAIAPILEPQLVVFAVVRHAARRVTGGAPIPAAIAAACAYVATELVVPKLFFDTLGQGLYPATYLRQAADIAGVHGLTLVVLLVNEGFADAIRTWTRARAARIPVPLAMSLGLVAVATGYGAVRYRQMAARGGRDVATSGAEGVRVQIGVVQANVTNYDKLRAEAGAYGAVRHVLDTHYALSDELCGRADLDLLVWPETVYPTTFGAPKSDAGAELDGEIRAFAAKRGVPLIFGAYDRDGDREYNAAFFLGGSGDRPPSSPSYRKRMLFPLTEWVPEALDAEWLRSALPWTGRWQRGPGAQAVEVPLREHRAITVVPLICYDALFTDYVAEGADKGADVIVTISNDSWFPDERAPRLHLISAAFRSIETRLPQVRATNSGISAVITPAGDMTSITPWAERAAIVANVAVAPRARPPRVLTGGWLAAVLGLLAAATLRAARSAQAESARG